MFARFIKMARLLEFSIFLLSFIVFVLSKELHVKQTLETKDKEIKGFMNIFNNQDVFMKNERYARHVKAVTESVLDHLINEIKHQYLSGNYNANSPIPRLIRNLNMELKRNERSKLQKEKAKRKKSHKNKNKKGTKKPIMMSTKSMLGINNNGKQMKNSLSRAGNTNNNRKDEKNILLKADNTNNKK